ncbi:glutamate-rich WD repeat-containing protein 1 [Ischnura elegans]|uniref:glutamate-rich WD repeat-containing protein 1 n=1 Tax=Ischnura elegans TaxID=197161 RepID=UPI001ED8BC25|nr:glutamate-rich WD repeat-containing protein 1 [Ischnura elegans]
MEVDDEKQGSGSSESSDDSMSEHEDDMEEESESNVPVKREVYLPGKSMKEDEHLVCDQSAYIMLHQATTGSPCLSFDIIKDDLGSDRSTYPLSAYLVAGTQSSKAHTNSVIVMKMSNLHKTQKIKSEDEEEDDDDDESDEEEDEEKKPKLDCALIKHQGCVNRIRAEQVNQAVLCASWSELGRVSIWDLSPQLRAVQNSYSLELYCSKATPDSDAERKPIFTFSGHLSEGFGIDWCPTVPGVLATGDCKSAIHIWQPDESGTNWKVDQRPLVGHTASVEDLQWSPNERHVLASCSVDKSIRIWDTRSRKCMLTASNAHDMDVNVISWNRSEPFIVSGGDDGKILVWDLRMFDSGEPVATFKHHISPVTTVEWHPKDSTVFASGGADDQVALWDISLEKDVEAEEGDSAGTEDLPPQLLFIHQGQKEVKELHWHPQIPGVIVSTALNGFNIFRTISV